MKITGAKSTSALVLAILAACIITARAQNLWPVRSRAASSSPPGARGAQTSPLSVKPKDPNATIVDITPILQKVARVADRTEPQTPELVLPSETPTPRSRTSTIRTADFYLKNGRLAFGKLVSEDRNKIIIEQIEGSNVIVATYSKRDIDPRTLQVKNISASKHYLDLAEYFAGRTGDFRDDPDDFIQAIRFYERAKVLITGTSKQDTEKIREIDQKVAMLEADRDVWTKQVQSRAKLRELEFQAEFQARFSELEAKINASTVKIDESVKRFDEVLAEVQQNSQKLEQHIPAMEQDLRRRLDILGAEVDANRRLIAPFGRNPYRYGYGTEFYYRRGY